MNHAVFRFDLATELEKPKPSKANVARAGGQLDLG